MHGQRIAYYVISEGVVTDAPPPGGHAAGAPESVPGLKFGRLFGKTQHMLSAEEQGVMVQKLIRLGLCMNDPDHYCGQQAGGGAGGDAAQDDAANDSDIPAGYTYLGQYIAHEVTFDSTGDLLAADMQFNNLRTPEIDLDSLYGSADGPKDEKSAKLYEPDGVRLRTDQTADNGLLTTKRFPNDLPRFTRDNPEADPPESRRQAIVGDRRNDENLAVAQTHVAFINFHNKVVATLEGAGTPQAELFQRAREQVIRHFQWVILHDFLPHLVRADVLDCVLKHGRRWFKAGDDGDLFMPLEFSAAAFRIGHSMVRARYDWNPYRRTAPSLLLGRVRLKDLFHQTGSVKSDKIGFTANNLNSDWIIDWRHFYDFGPLAPGVVPVQSHNKSAKLDTNFDLHLDTIEGFADDKIDKMQKALTVRNLLRGFYLGLPTGEEVADWIGETPLTRKQVSSGRHENLLDHPLFWGKTPLWYYILKEAELLGFSSPDGRPDANGPGNRLGPVGSRIVAETLVGLIEHSGYSILKDEGWRPRPDFGRIDAATGETHFGMIDLLKFAGVVDPVASYLRGKGTVIPGDG